MPQAWPSPGPTQSKEGSDQGSIQKQLEGGRGADLQSRVLPHPNRPGKKFGSKNFARKIALKCDFAPFFLLWAKKGKIAENFR